MADTAIEILSKRLRNLTKKASKIQEIERKVLGGVALQPEQLQTLASKGVNDAVIKEIEALKSSMEQLASPVAPKVTDHEPSVLTEADVLKAAESIAVDVSKLAISSSGKSDGSAESETGGEADRADTEKRLRMLILLIHVAANYSQKCNNKPLPDAVEYFGSALLGRASVSGFSDTVEKSLRGAGLYMYVSEPYS
tara:strand:- start:69 stop:656 length:588 start_codon:yes stop_codon:yes gene_type:complete